MPSDKQVSQFVHFNETKKYYPKGPGVRHFVFSWAIYVMLPTLFIAGGFFRGL